MTGPGWRERVLAGLALTIAVGAPYQLTVRHPLYEPHVLSWSAADRLVPFLPGLAGLYLSLFALMALPLLGATTRAQLWRYLLAAGACAWVAAPFLLLMPTAVARPPAPSGSLLALIQLLDPPGNARPALHAALAVVAVVALLAPGRRAITAAALIAWAGAIVLAALAVRQHGAFDLALGAALGLAAATLLDPGAGLRDDPAPCPAELATRAAARDLVARSGIDPAGFRRRDAVALLHLALGPALAAAGVALALHASSWPAQAAGIALIALALNVLFLVMHEAVHEVLLPWPMLGHVVASLCGLPGLGSHAAYRVLHLRHHRYLGDGRDPDDYANYTGRPRMLALMHLVRLVLGTLVYLVAVPLIAWRHGGRGVRRWMLAEAALGLAAHATLVHVAGGRAWLLLVALPLLGVNLLINARGLTQHTACASADPLRSSRSVRAGPILRLLLLNENHHREHHLFPAVPACQLHRLHLALRAHLPQEPQASSYPAFVLRFLGRLLRGDHRPVL